MTQEHECTLTECAPRLDHFYCAHPGGGFDLPAPERSPGNKRLNLCATCIVPGEAAEDATTDVSVPAGGRARRRRCPSSHVSRRRESVREPVWA